MPTETAGREIGRLRAPIRHYEWGSRRVIAELQGRPVPTERPEAELWLGAHPADPALVERSGRVGPLDALIAADPVGELGQGIVDSFGVRLPFLLKVLGVAEPLSLQVHPSAEQAAQGYDAEEAQHIPLGAPHRNYRDPWPKPELLCALSPFTALCGFRPIDATAALLSALGGKRLAAIARQLQVEGEAALGPVVRALLCLPAAERGPLVGEVADGARRLAGDDGPFASVADRLLRLAERYPEDPGVAVALLLDLVRLERGEAVYLPAGVPHAYLEGSGVEIMGCSDNVLRGGLTSKHVDVDALLAVLDTRIRGDQKVRPVRASNQEVIYPAPAREFRLSRLEVAGEVALDRRGGEVLLCVEGAVSVSTDGERADLVSGDAVFIAARADVVTVGGEGTVFRATVGEG